MSHRKFAASAAHRWLACTASHALESAIPSVTSSYAKEGTEAHAIAAYLLLGGTLEPGEKIAYHNDGKEEIAIVDNETLESIAPYIDFIRGAIAKGATDLRVEFSADLIPNVLGGTTDAAYLRRDTLHVCDLKYGEGVLVDPTENAQLMVYALALLPYYPTAKQLCLNIIQPRARGEIVKQWRCPIARLNDFFTDVLQSISNIESNTTSFKRGEHCQFCKALHGCPSYLDLITEDKLQDSAHVLDHIDEIRALCSAVEKDALTRLHNGEKIAGWKLVQTQGKSIWTKDALENLRANTDLIKETLIGITEARKIYGENLNAFITKSSGIAMVRSSDKRPEISDSSMLDEIKGDEDNDN